MGPSIGWQMAPASVVLPITAVGTTTVAVGNSLVTVNINGPVTIQLPSALGNPVGAAAVPGTWIPTPITVMDVGGFANATTAKITILPFGSETIDGVASITIESPYAAYVLRPRLVTGGWTLVQ